MAQTPKIRSSRWLAFVAVAFSCTLASCHRGYYRRQADRDAQSLVEQKATDPRWDSATGSIAIDPYSRMFNPFSSDHPPLPPDDPASHEFMHCVDNKRGYPHWHANGDTDYVENPEWMAYLPVNEKGQVVLSLDRAYQLALIHSPDYQAQLETLYLSALDVSLERFSFDTQGFVGFNSFMQRQGRIRAGSSGPRTQMVNSLGVNGGGIGLGRLGTTGATYAAGLANTILFNISGSSSRSANSLLDFSIVQPLLRGAGRDRIMEGLTQSERTLLANVRQLERYRRGFFLQVTTGRPAGAGPNRFGSFLNLPAGAPIGTGGFYGLLVQQTQIRNQEFAVRQLQAVLDQFRELNNVGRLDPVQLRLLESTVFNQQSALVEAHIRYQSTLDRFVQSIGLPPDLDVVIEDDSLSQFHLISDEINDRLAAVGDLRRDTGLQTAKVVELMPGSAEEADHFGFAWNEELGKRIEGLLEYLEEAQSILETTSDQDVALLRQDLQRLDSVRPEREKYLRELRNSEDSEGIINVLDAGLYSPASIPTSEYLLEFLEGAEKDGIKSALTRLEELKLELAETKQQLVSLPQLQQGLDSQQLYKFITENFQEAIPARLSKLNTIVLELSLLQARARANSIEMTNVDIDADTAIAIARCFRHDWMNARASLVDNWRQIEFVADQLESQLDLVFQADIGTVGSNPLQFRDANGQIRAGFRFDTPMVRMIERNQYRETLIRYQQARRQFYQFEDEAKRNIRDIVRNLNRDKVLFELNRLAVQNQIEQIELSRLNLDAPQMQPAGGGGGGDQGGGGGAGGRSGGQLGDAAARNLADAFNQMNAIQNRYIGTFVEYEILRQSLDFDMGTMMLDETGSWIDPGLIDNTIGIRTASLLGIEMDCQFCRDDIINPVVRVRDFSSQEESFPSGSENNEAPEIPLPQIYREGSQNGDAFRMFVPNGRASDLPFEQEP